MLRGLASVAAVLLAGQAVAYEGCTDAAWTNYRMQTGVTMTLYYGAGSFAGKADATHTTASNVTMQARDVMAFETWDAARERSLVTGPTDAGNAGFFRDYRADLVAFKGWLPGAMAGASWVTPDAWDESNPANWRTNHIGLAALLARVGAPSNYCDYTPWRYLHPLDGGPGRVVTTSYTIACSPGATVTNIVTNYCGDADTIIGTNGQAVTTVCTNDPIVPGFVEADYGYKHVRAIISNLQWTAWSGGAYNSLPYGYTYADDNSGGHPGWAPDVARFYAATNGEPWYTWEQFPVGDGGLTPPTAYSAFSTNIATFIPVNYVDPAQYGTTLLVRASAALKSYQFHTTTPERVESVWLDMDAPSYGRTVMNGTPMTAEYLAESWFPSADPGWGRFYCDTTTVDNISWGGLVREDAPPAAAYDEGKVKGWQMSMAAILFRWNATTGGFKYR